MSLKKYGVIVGCEYCVCTSSDGHGSFDVKVPINDMESDITGTAILHCTVSQKQHQVELKEWLDTDLRSITTSATLQQRISATLAFVANQRICGNHHICPSEIIQLVRG